MDLFSASEDDLDDAVAEELDGGEQDDKSEAVPRHVSKLRLGVYGVKCKMYVAGCHPVCSPLYSTVLKTRDPEVAILTYSEWHAVIGKSISTFSTFTFTFLYLPKLNIFFSANKTIDTWTGTRNTKKYFIELLTSVYCKMQSVKVSRSSEK